VSDPPATDHPTEGSPLSSLLELKSLIKHIFHFIHVEWAMLDQYCAEGTKRWSKWRVYLDNRAGLVQGMGVQGINSKEKGIETVSDIDSLSSDPVNPIQIFLK
jgi:hypothetical protein